MTTILNPTRSRRPFNELTAADLMTANPVSVRSSAPVREAVRFLTDKGVSGAMVIDEAGRPLGVLSTSDIMIHNREGSVADLAIVADIMTPIVFSVRLETKGTEVVERMVDLNVHRVFVQDGTGVVVGVISAIDVLRHIR
jgi:predicted transcriptional regulator